MGAGGTPAGLTAVVVANIRAIRKAHGWTQTDFAARVAGFDRGTVSKIENYQRGITVPDLEALGAAFGIEPWRLLRPLQTAVTVVDGPEPASQAEESA